MSDLVVRAYNVGFGDAILLEIPERKKGAKKETVRFLLIDVGNLLTRTWNENKVFNTVVDDIMLRTGQKPVDLYVLTHEHLDHAGGLLPASKAGHPLAARFAWLTGSADPEYYKTHKEAEKQATKKKVALEDAERMLAAAPDDELERTLLNNITWKPPGVLGAASTDDHVQHLRTIAPKTHYVDRTTKLAGKHPFTEAKLTILAPEEDTSFYYGRSLAPGTLTSRTLGDAPAPADTTTAPGLPVPPPGVDPGAYFDLVHSRTDGWRRNVMEIDKAANNTSLVLLIEWRGWRLLFPGDAEWESWTTMDEKGLLAPVDFIKVSHHGSENGTDIPMFGEKLFPVKKPDKKRARYALISTHTEDWESIPNPAAYTFYGPPRFTKFYDTRFLDDGKERPRGEFVEIRFPG
jgi:hypothetical protein